MPWGRQTPVPLNGQNHQQDLADDLELNKLEQDTQEETHHHVILLFSGALGIAGSLGL